MKTKRNEDPGQRGQVEGQIQRQVVLGQRRRGPGRSGQADNEPPIESLGVVPLVILMNGGKGYHFYHVGDEYPTGEVTVEEVQENEPELSDEEALEEALEYAQEMALEGGEGDDDFSDEDGEEE